MTQYQADAFVPLHSRGEKEFIVEEILDSRVINQKLRYLIKWEGYGIKHNSWEAADDVHTPERIMDFHRRHPGAPRHIRFADFDAIPFRTLSSVVPGRHSLEGGVDVRGCSFSPSSQMEYLCSTTPNTFRLCDTLYVPPHRQYNLLLRDHLCPHFLSIDSYGSVTAP